MTTKPPLRPASPIDAELAKPHPEEIIEIEKQKHPAEGQKQTTGKTSAGDR